MQAARRKCSVRYHAVAPIAVKGHARSRGVSVALYGGTPACLGGVAFGGLAACRRGRASAGAFFARPCRAARPRGSAGRGRGCAASAGVFGGVSWASVLLAGGFWFRRVGAASSVRAAGGRLAAGRVGVSGGGLSGVSFLWRPSGLLARLPPLRLASPPLSSLRLVPGGWCLRPLLLRSAPSSCLAAAPSA
jgi:hypothetical protein